MITLTRDEIIDAVKVLEKNNLKNAGIVFPVARNSHLGMYIQKHGMKKAEKDFGVKLVIDHNV